MKRLLLLILVVLGAVHCEFCDARIMISAKLDSVQMMMGGMNNLCLQTVLPKGRDGDFPQFREITSEGLIHLIGDTLELRPGMSPDTTKLGSGMLQLTYNIPLQCFYPGTYNLPAIKYVVGTDTVVSNELVLKVVAPDVAATDTISPDIPPVGPYYNSAFEKYTDAIPDAIYYYWWIFLISIAAVIAFMWAWKKRKMKSPLKIIAKKTQLPPYEAALIALNKLKGEKLWERGEERVYYTRLTAILRTYLQQRFGINAMEMTSDQIRGAVKHTTDASSHKEYMERVLSMADYVKFAKMRPLPDDNIAAFTNALEFIEGTKPIPVKQEDVTGNIKKKGGEQ